MSERGSTIYTNSTLVAKVTKNRIEEFRIYVLRNNMVDLRVYMFFPDDPESHPTKKGIWLSFPMVSQIITELEKLESNPATEINLVFERPKSDQIRVYVNEFKGNKLVHIRTYYLNEVGYQPSNKGVSFALTLAPQIKDALKKAYELRED